MAKFIQDGKIIDYKNIGSSKINYGDVIKLGTHVGIAAEDIHVGETGGVRVEGIFEMEAVSPAEFNLGDTLYLDDSNKATNVQGRLTIVIGYAVTTKASSETVVKVKLG